MSESDVRTATAHDSTRIGRPAPIGILGGTFDPIHCGHLRIALDAVEDLTLAKVHLVPLNVAVHRAQPLACVADRWEMLRRAVTGIAELVADDRELRRGGESYTVETLRNFRQQFGTERPLCLLLGTDAFEGFTEWREPETIAELAHIVVMQRPGYQPPDDTTLKSPTAVQIASTPEELRTRPGGRILFHTVTQLDISSSDLRTRVAAGQSVRFLVPDGVLQVIDDKGLYRSRTASGKISAG